MISVLVVAFIYSSYSRAFAEPADRNWGEGGGCDVSPDFNVVTCCWTEPDLYNPGELVTWCQSCDSTGRTAVRFSWTADELVHLLLHKAMGFYNNHQVKVKEGYCH